MTEIRDPCPEMTVFPQRILEEPTGGTVTDKARARCAHLPHRMALSIETHRHVENEVVYPHKHCGPRLERHDAEPNSLGCRSGEQSHSPVCSHECSRAWAK